MWRFSDKAQIPVNFKCPKLRRAEKEQVLFIRDLELENIADCREPFAGIARFPPLAGIVREILIKVVHWSSVSGCWVGQAVGILVGSLIVNHIGV